MDNEEKRIYLISIISAVLAIVSIILAFCN
nr:MAG TPA: hypothetical protein [Caudoviricetes sp.]